MRPNVLTCVAALAAIPILVISTRRAEAQQKDQPHGDSMLEMSR